MTSAAILIPCQFLAWALCKKYKKRTSRYGFVNLDSLGEIAKETSNKYINFIYKTHLVGLLMFAILIFIVAIYRW